MIMNTEEQKEYWSKVTNWANEREKELEKINKDIFPSIWTDLQCREYKISIWIGGGTRTIKETKKLAEDLVIVSQKLEESLKEMKEKFPYWKS